MKSLRGWFKHRWRVLSMLSVVVVLVVLAAGGYNQTVRNRHENERIDQRVDKVRKPVCQIMIASLARPPLDQRPTTLEARQTYLAAIGPDGLNCEGWERVATPAQIEEAEEEESNGN